MSCNFLYDQFYSLEYVLLGGLFWCVVIFFTIGAVSFALVKALPHGTSFIPTLLSETVRSLSLCREISRGRLGGCVHMLQLWFSSHLSAIFRDQLVGFVSRNRFRATIVLDLPFSGDNEDWLRYLCSLSPADWTTRVKWGITRWQRWTHCVSLLSTPLVGI